MDNRKLYINIEKIRINGDISALSQPVINIDKCLQELTNETIKLRNMLYKYYDDNASNQYKKAIESSNNLAKKLTLESKALNELQTEIVRLQENMIRFNDKKQYIAKHFGYYVMSINIPEKSGVFRAVVKDLVTINNGIMRYINGVGNGVKKIKADKASIGMVWKDPQYVLFSNRIDEICHILNVHMNVLQEYSGYLNNKIKGLRNV